MAKTSNTAAPLKVVISIINYKTADLTIQAAESVLADLGDVHGRVVIVDNCSEDGSDDRLKGWYEGLAAPEKVKLVFSDRNGGFSGGHNLGLAADDAEYYLVLNSDAVVKPGFLAALIKAADQRPEMGLFAPRIDYEDGGQQTNCFRFPTPSSEFIRTARTGFVTKLLSRKTTSLGTTPENDQIEWASFACILLRRAMVKSVGVMDEGYFLYFEDAAYCLKARRKGWNVAYVADALAIHFRGGSGPVKSLQKAHAELPRYYYASRTRFFYQAYGYLGLIFANILWHLGSSIRFVRRTFDRSVPRLPRNEYKLIWTNISDPLGNSYGPRSSS